MARKVKKSRIVLIGAGGSLVEELLTALRAESALDKYKIDSATISSVLEMAPDEREKCVIVYIRVPYFLRVERLLRAGIQNCEDMALKDTTLYDDAEQVADLTVRNFVVTSSVGEILEYFRKR
jgi:hypothetical protein